MPEPINKEDEVKLEVASIIDKQRELESLESALAQNEQFQQFLAMKKEFDAVSAELWKRVEQQMIDNDIKSIKGDWGSITLAERLNFKTTDELPSKFYKKVVDTTKLAATYKLEGKPIKGAEPYYTKYITKRLK